VDKKPERDILDAQIKGGGKEVPANEGKLDLIGTDPNDPVTGAITHPNGTFGPIFILPSIRDADGNIKDPVQDKDKLTYSPCVGDGTCDAAASARFVSSARHGKFAPVEVGSDEDAAEQAQPDDSSAAPRMRHVPHEDKVEMQDAEMSADGESHDAPAAQDSDDSNSDSSSDNEDSSSDNEDQSSNNKDSSSDDSNTVAPEMSEIETGSRVVKDETQAGGFTPTFSDDDSASSSPSTSTTQDNTATPSPSADTSPRFQQSRRSETHSMSGSKDATQSKDNTMEVTEFDETVTGGKKINEDEDAPVKAEADDKQ
jgi:ferredoxin